MCLRGQHLFQNVKDDTVTTAPIPDSRMGLLAASLRRFGRAEDGGLMVLSLVLFMLMLLMGGLAVDLMRYETCLLYTSRCV